MPKNKKQQREESGPERTFTISGGPSMGYTICLNKEPLLVHFSRMWEAIECRDDLNRGRPMIDFEQALRRAKAGPVAPPVAV